MFILDGRSEPVSKQHVSGTVTTLQPVSNRNLSLVPQGSRFDPEFVQGGVVDPDEVEPESDEVEPGYVQEGVLGPDSLGMISTCSLVSFAR